MVMNDSVVYVGFWSRVGATLIDSFLLIFVTGIILYVTYGAFHAIAVIAFWCRYSATPGKMAISAVIVDARTGARMSVLQCILRYLAYIPAVLPLGLGIIWVGIDKRKQGWHDKLANTVVVRKETIAATSDDR